jgi:oxalate decarboxylase
MRVLHWHPNANEWQYYVRGRARIKAFGAIVRASVVEFGLGDHLFDWEELHLQDQGGAR